MKPSNYLNLEIFQKLRSFGLMRTTMVGIAFLSILLRNIPDATAQYRPGDPSFFEDGEEQFNREIERLNEDRENDPDLLTIDDSTSGWRQITSHNGRFAVAMPGTPTVTPNPEILVTPAADLELLGVTLQQEEESFLVAYGDYPDAVNVRESELLAQVRDALVSGFGAELTGDRQLSDRSGPGREIRLSTPDAETTFRVYLIDRRLYLLGVEQTVPISEDLDLAQFFESFVPGAISE
ncbi:hypothetical protein [Zarconia navalis]|nr:hypothetical protein [Zarconia navalis]